MPDWSFYGRDRPLSELRKIANEPRWFLPSLRGGGVLADERDVAASFVPSVGTAAEGSARSAIGYLMKPRTRFGLSL